MRLTIEKEGNKCTVLKDGELVVKISYELLQDLNKLHNIDNIDIIDELRNALRFEVADESLEDEIEIILKELGKINSYRYLTIGEYQEKAVATAIYGDGQSIIYPTLGLTGEAGEVADKVKKVLRDNNGEFTPEVKLEIAKEISDVLWYCAALSRDLGFSLAEIAQMNLDKLKSRMERGVISGSGDNR